MRGPSIKIPLIKSEIKKKKWLKNQKTIFKKKGKINP